MKDTAGKVYREVLHPGWSIESWKKLMGRVTDLKSAYKQLARFPGHRSLSVIAVNNPNTMKNLSSKAFEMVKQRYTCDKIAEGFYGIYKNIEFSRLKMFYLLLIINHWFFFQLT